MPWAGGSYTKWNGSGGWTADAAANIGIEAGRHDTQDTDFQDGINACLNKDGSNSATGNLNLGNNKLTVVANATTRSDAPSAAQVIDGSFVWLGTTSGTATAQTASATPSPGTYTTGQKFRMKVGTGLASTGSTATAHTLNVNSLGTKNIVHQSGTNPTAGSWIAGAILEVVYDGTNFVIVNDPGGWQAWTPTVTVTGGTASSVVTSSCRYRRWNNEASVVVIASFTISGATSAAGKVTFSSVPISQVLGTSYDTTYNYIGGATPVTGTPILTEVSMSGTTLTMRLDPILAQVWTNGAANIAFEKRFLLTT